MTQTLIGDGNHAGLIKETTIDSFTDDVLVASRQVPVLVDFWATWCGPCKTLGPALEKAVTRAGGKVQLVKVDIDKNQMLAQQLRIQSVPTVMTFIAGQPVDAFQGALPETQITAYIDRAIEMAAQAGMNTPSPEQDPEAMLDAAQAIFDAGDLAAAAQSYGMIAEQVDKDSAQEARALAGLVQCHIASQNLVEAGQLLEIIPDIHRALPAVASARAALSLAHVSPPSAGDLVTLKATAAKTPEDQELQLALANAQISSGDMANAAHTLLAMVAYDREWNDSAARQKLLTLFDALGPTHEITLKARRNLSSLLFS